MAAVLLAVRDAGLHHGRAMSTIDRPGTPASGDPQQAAVEAVLERSKRTTRRVNIRNGFVQGGAQRRPVPGPLHLMLKAHDERALDLFLLHRALVSREPWVSFALDARVWGRALGLGGNADAGVTAVSKTWRRLERHYRLVAAGRDGRLAVFTCLREDGSGAEYTSPNGKTREERYLTLPFAYWTDPHGWYRTLSFPAKAMLLVTSSLGPGCVLPTERTRGWYGISTESAERGLRELRHVGLLDRETTVKPAPLSPLGKTQEYRYTLARPFGRAHRRRLTVIAGTAAS